MLKGAYSLWDTCGPISVLNEGYKHLILGEQGHYTMEVAKGHHWIVGFNIAAGCLAYYIYRLKQERAAELLLNNVSISSIVEQLGYSDGAAFRKAFKKYHGVSPGAYIHTER